MGLFLETSSFGPSFAYSALRVVNWVRWVRMRVHV
jgi:hypothetical protein